MLMPATLDQRPSLKLFINQLPFPSIPVLHRSIPMGHPNHNPLRPSIPTSINNPSSSRRIHNDYLDPIHNRLHPISHPDPTPPKAKIISHLPKPFLSQSSLAQIARSGSQTQFIPQSTDSQNTESTPSSSSPLTPDLHQPTNSPAQKLSQALPHPRTNGFHSVRTPNPNPTPVSNPNPNTLRSTPKTPNSRKRKPGRPLPDSSDSSHSASGPLTKYRSSRLSNPSTPLHRPSHQTPKRQRTVEPAAQRQTSEHMAMPNHFTTQRFPTPKSNLQPNGDTSITPDPTDGPSDQSPYTRDAKGKARETRPPSRSRSRSRSARSRSRSQHAGYSDQSDCQLDSRPGSSSKLRTPKSQRDTSDYEDVQQDGEVTIISGETPVQCKNRQFRQGAGGKQKDQRTGLGHDSEPSTGHRSRSGSSGTSNGHLRHRRGSRASSIGCGHEALPHPRIPPGMLHRHIQPDLPPPMRCRTLLSWCSQKAEDACEMVLQPASQPKRLIVSDLPSALRKALQGLARPDASIRPSQAVAKAVKMAMQRFTTGVCESEVRVDMSAGGRAGQEEESSFEISAEQSIVDIESLPRHPQDLKNEQKIKELNQWRTRMSYEDHARQFQLARYNTLIENLTRRPLGFQADGPSRLAVTDGQRLETARLCNKAAVVEYGRVLRAQGGEPSRRVDVLEEHGEGWLELPVTMGVLAEEFSRLAAKVRTVEAKVRRLQAGSTQKLKGLEEHGAVSRIEAKLMDPNGLRLEALNIGTGTQLEGPRSLEQRGKRDFLRSLCRCVED